MTCGIIFNFQHDPGHLEVQHTRAIFSHCAAEIIHERPLQRDYMELPETPSNSTSQTRACPPSMMKGCLKSLKLSQPFLNLYSPICMNRMHLRVILFADFDPNTIGNGLVIEIKLPNSYMELWCSDNNQQYREISIRSRTVCLGLFK